MASTALGKPTTPAVVGGAGGLASSGRERCLAQSEIPSEIANAPAMIRSPSSLSRRRAGSLGGGVEPGAETFMGSGAIPPLSAGFLLLAPRKRRPPGAPCEPSVAVRAIARYEARLSSPPRGHRAHNSAVECVLHTDEVAGSIPAAPTGKQAVFVLSFEQPCMADAQLGE